uniref:DUF4114 domain-containing protein n=1 Tax=Steinernema glaseri TaxID=37863 RepID=A0A1I7YT11_9BILA
MNKRFAFLIVTAFSIYVCAQDNVTWMETNSTWPTELDNGTLEEGSKPPVNGSTERPSGNNDSLADLPRPDSCDEADLKGRKVAGFYWNVFFYFVYDEPETELDLTALFGDLPLPTGPLHAETTPNCLVPLDDTRVLLFFTRNETVFYTFYELDNLNEHGTNGAAQMVHLHTLAGYELKYADDIPVSPDDTSECKLQYNEGLVFLEDRVLNVDIDLAGSSYNYQHFTEELHVNDTERFFFVEGEESDCAFAYTISAPGFEHVRLLPGTTTPPPMSCSQPSTKCGTDYGLLWIAAASGPTFLICLPLIFGLFRLFHHFCCSDVDI